MKINYSGSNLAKDWDYICEDCKLEVIIVHGRQDDMSHRHCAECDGLLLRHIKSIPSLGADYHDSQLTRNIGWSTEGGLQ